MSSNAPTLTTRQQLYIEAVKLDVALYQAFIKEPTAKTSRILAKSQKRVDRRDRKAEAEQARARGGDYFTYADPGL